MTRVDETFPYREKLQQNGEKGQKSSSRLTWETVTPSKSAFDCRLSYSKRPDGLAVVVVNDDQSKSG